MIKDILKFLGFVVFLFVLLGAGVLFLYGRSFGRVSYGDDEMIVDSGLSSWWPGYQNAEVVAAAGGGREPRRVTFTAQINTPQPILCQGTAEAEGFDPVNITVWWDTLACVEQAQLVKLADLARYEDLTCHADPAAQVLRYWIDAGYISLEDVPAPAMQAQVRALLEEPAPAQRVLLFDPAPSERRSQKNQKYILRCDGTLELYAYSSIDQSYPDYDEANGDIWIFMPVAQ